MALVKPAVLVDGRFMLLDESSRRQSPTSDRSLVIVGNKKFYAGLCLSSKDGDAER